HMRTGRLSLPLGLFTRDVPGLAGAADFYGINYYGSYRVRFDPATPLLGRWVNASGATEGVSQWGEVDPDGLRWGLLRVAALGRPVYVTENGLRDPSDERRRPYLVRHLAAVREAIAAGADVRGYFHWTLVDNYEWAEGWRAPFGLIAVNPATQERRPRPSFDLYGGIARANGLMGEIVEGYRS
ncbi:MAG TPA: family 1 glycosylhydrolase, partial [Ardenticatenaceae bacterium]|nr:family 1 glycosylhydrolase [Ardenticatenaceae bacterium]